MVAGPLKNIMAGAAAMTVLTGPAFAEDQAPKEPIQVAQLEGSPQQVSFTDAAQGKPVQLIHGSGVSSLRVDIAEQTIINAGCPVSSRVLGARDRMLVYVDDHKVISTSDILDATSEAIEHCAPGQS